MTNLKQGKLYITKEDILNYMGLSEDTHLDINESPDGIEINVIASSENKQDFLTDKVAPHSQWDFARVRIPLVK